MDTRCGSHPKHLIHGQASRGGRTHAEMHVDGRESGMSRRCRRGETSLMTSWVHLRYKMEGEASAEGARPRRGQSGAHRTRGAPGRMMDRAQSLLRHPTSPKRWAQGSLTSIPRGPVIAGFHSTVLMKCRILIFGRVNHVVFFLSLIGFVSQSLVQSGENDDIHQHTSNGKGSSIRRRP